MAPVEHSRRARSRPPGTGESSTPSTDRQLLEEVVIRLRRLEPLIEAAERHPLIRHFLRRT